MKVPHSTRKRHDEAVARLRKDTWSIDMIQEVYPNLHAGCLGDLNVNSSFYTPWDLAEDASVEFDFPSGGVLDLCAGFGILGLHVWLAAAYRGIEPPNVTCLESDPHAIEIGRLVFPQATWVLGDVLNWKPDKPYQGFVSNPPFKQFQGSRFEYRVAENGIKWTGGSNSFGGVMIVPQSILNWKASGQDSYLKIQNDKYTQWSHAAAIRMEPSCLDTTLCARFENTSIVTEIVIVEPKSLRT